MKNKKIIILLLLVFSLILTGCTKKNEIDDIKKYIEDNIQINNYKLDNSSTSKKGDDSYTDYYWHVKYEDIEFDVIDNYKWGVESLTNVLESDFDIKVLDFYYSKYNKKYNIIYKKDYIFNENHLICESADDQKVIDELKIKECYNSSIEFINTIDFNKYPLKRIFVEITNKSQHVKWLKIFDDGNIKTFDEFNYNY